MTQDESFAPVPARRAPSRRARGLGESGNLEVVVQGLGDDLNRADLLLPPGRTVSASIAGTVDTAGSGATSLTLIVFDSDDATRRLAVTV